MSLSSDSEPFVPVKSIAFQEKINKDSLQEIQDDLDLDETISILFLMVNDYTQGFEEIYDLYQRHGEENFYMLTKFIDNHPQNWNSKLLESLCIIQNQQIIRRLGIRFSDLDLLYSPKTRLCSRNLNCVAKCLYSLCEEFTDTDTVSLIQNVKRDFSVEYEKHLKDIDYLELHILYWLQEKYISINSDGKVSLKNLLKHLKKFDAIEPVYEDLKKCEDSQNRLDVQNVSLSMAQLRAFSTTHRTTLKSNEQDDIKNLTKGLCIIINHMYFGKKFETRDGTYADCENLFKTFKGFGFTVKMLNNLKKDKLLKKLKDIPKEYGTDYECIFVCILSHGYKGGIISSDEKQVNIETIEHRICCEELSNVIKVVIIQACQGEVNGEVDNTLTTDSPSDGNVTNISAYRNFCIFMSTMQGFVSVRHKQEGTWFIQDLCKILQREGHKITFQHAANKIIESVAKKKGQLNGQNFIAQLPELRSCRLLTDFRLPAFQQRTS